MWDIIIHPYPNFKGGSIKPPLKLGHGWVNAFPYFTWIIIYPCHNPEAVLGNFSSKRGALKRKFNHFDDFFIAGCTESC